MPPTLPCLEIQDDTIPVHPHATLEWTLPTADVARGFGCSEEAIRSQKTRHADELVEEKHWVVADCNTPGGKQELVHWTRRGVIRLGFFLRSKRAKLFRDAAEDLILAQTAEPRVSVKPEAIAERVAAALLESDRLLVLVDARIRAAIGEHPPAQPVSTPRGPVWNDLLETANDGPCRLLAYLRQRTPDRTDTIRVSHRQLGTGRRQLGQWLRQLQTHRFLVVQDPGLWQRTAYRIRLNPIPPQD